jgi:peptide deformylase
MNLKSLPKIVPVAEIPKGQDVPLDNLLEVFRVCTQLERICYDHDGVGLSAVQVGIPWNMFVKLNSIKPFYECYINCRYEGIGDKELSIEGCLSLQDANSALRRFEVMRYEKIRMIGKELIVNEKPDIIEYNKELGGLSAIVCQHEIDHAHQILISDIGLEIELLGS